jgi:hypothetical protein
MENLLEYTEKELELRQMYNEEIPFWADYCNDAKKINFDGNVIPKAYYNLIVSIRDCGLHNIGMKPHRFFKISDVKKYFGLKGNSKTFADQLKHLKQLLEC